MSTLTQAQPGTAGPARLLSMPLAATFLAEFTSLTSFFLLLSVMPMLAAAGSGSSGAGALTGSLLLGAVAAEAVAAAAIGRFGFRMVLAAGAVLLGTPALAMLAREPQAVMVGVSVVRGLGFGLCGVATGALTAKLLPSERRGEGLGLLGVVSGVPAVVALPAGVWLAGHHLAAAAAAMAAVAGLLPLVAIRWLPDEREVRRTARAARMPGARSSNWMAGAALRLPLIFAAATIAAGVLDSFLPLAKGIPSNLSSAALLVQAITATLSRWQAGKHGDRYGHARLLIPALAVGALGVAAMMMLSSPAAIFAGMVLFGAGFGVIENATFALLIEQLPEANASALWNLAYDAGYGAGPAVFGLICVRTGYPAAFALTGALILAAVPVAVRQRKAVARALPGRCDHVDAGAKVPASGRPTATAGA
jgi:MFS family permease